jgi:hypothetical protein
LDPPHLSHGDGFEPLFLLCDQMVLKHMVRSRKKEASVRWKVMYRVVFPELVPDLPFSISDDILFPGMKRMVKN